MDHYQLHAQPGLIFSLIYQSCSVLSQKISKFQYLFLCSFHSEDRGVPSLLSVFPVLEQCLRHNKYLRNVVGVFDATKQRLQNKYLECVVLLLVEEN